MLSQRKTTFLTKSMSPMVCSRIEYKRSCYGFTTFGHLGNHFTTVVSTLCVTLCLGMKLCKVILCQLFEAKILELCLVLDGEL